MGGLVRDEVVDVMRTLPPSHRQAATKVGNEEADEGVDGEDLADGPMSCVVGREHDLVLCVLATTV